jgi:adenine deaminase
MRMADSLGAVAAGRVADLLIVDADPLRDVGHVRRIHAVVARGRLLRRPDLDALLDRAAREAPSDRPLAPAQPPSATGRPSSSSSARAFAWVAGPGRAR